MGEEEYKDFVTELFCKNIHDNSIKSFLTSFLNNKTISKEKVESFSELFRDDEDE